jgi:hypothetical protein
LAKQRRCRQAPVLDGVLAAVLDVLDDVEHAWRAERFARGARM